jgi:hypothetical protein
MGPLGQYLPNWLPEDPGKNAAARQGLLTAGAALMGGRGNLGEILGGGLLAGSQGYQGALQQQQQEQLRQAQMKQLGLENQKIESSIAKPGKIAGVLSGMRTLGGTAPSAAADAPPRITPVGELPRLGQPATGAPQAQAPALPSVASPDYLFNYYRRRGDALADAGYMDEAKDQYAFADKQKAKLMKQEARMVGGQRVLANVYEDGRTEQVDGFAPDAEKLHFANTGGSTVALDQYTGKPANTIRNTQSPDSVASGQVQMRGQNMTDARAREQLEAGRNQVVQSDEGPVLVNTRSGAGKVVTGPDGQRLGGVTKPLTDAQSKALLFGSRMQESNKVLDGLAKSGTTSSIPGARAPLIGGVINTLSGGNQQSLEQAKRDFMTAVLRRESGAAIADSEFATADQQYFPQIGDSAQVIAQKARNRDLAIRGVLAEVPEKQRASIVPRDQLPKKAVSAQAFSDAEKERRYQEWKRSQGK